MKLKLPRHAGWFALGLFTFALIAADVTTTMFDSTYFSTSDTSVSLKGSLTNFFKLTTNAFQTAGSYQPASSTLTNLSNGIGTNLTTLLSIAVQAGQTNDGTGNWTASGTNSTQTIGRVGIGTPTPSFRLDVFSAEPSIGQLKLGFDLANSWNLGRDNISNGRFAIVNANDSSERLSILTGGNVGISTNAPTEALEVRGNVKASGVATVDGLVNTGTTVHTPSAIQSLTAASNVLVNASTMRVNGSGGAVTLTSTPSIQTNNIADGTVITIRGTDDTNTVTLQDYRTLAGTCLAMEVATVTLKNGSEMRFQWSNGNQRWQSLAFSANSSQNHPFKDATATGWLTASAFDYNAPATLTPTDAGVSIDFGAANRLATCTLTGAVTFAFSN